jgi:CRP-like cAMP-binding protein
LKVEEQLTLCQGQYFGEVGIIEKKLRNASVIALEDSDIFLLEKSFFEVSIGVINIITY